MPLLPTHTHTHLYTERERERDLTTCHCCHKYYEYYLTGLTAARKQLKPIKPRFFVPLHQIDVLFRLGICIKCCKRYFFVNIKTSMVPHPVRLKVKSLATLLPFCLCSYPIQFIYFFLSLENAHAHAFFFSIFRSAEELHNRRERVSIIPFSHTKGVSSFSQQKHEYTRRKKKQIMAAFSYC